MEANQQLYQFMSDNTWNLTEDWYESLDKSDPSGIYSSKDPVVIQNMKRQNHAFHEHFCELFRQNKCEGIESFEEWITEIAQDEEHLKTPIHYILREFFRTQEQYLELIQKFIEIHEGEYTEQVKSTWRDMVVKVFSLVMTRFSEENYNYSQVRLNAQQAVIKELSSPVISLNKNTAVLPLIGDIDTGRARYILENTLTECASKNVEHLFIDLSGVIMVDTMVAHQIFQIVDSLNLLGVNCTLSGIRPEIAQTAIQLGISFEKVSVTSTLERAINNLGL
ncbi:STAS domain-containing protein [Rossellomorea aquimaris]|uniref:STAS domain-containing protein n=1 Tax=Rossellomorea aquimaris TaxID=189382 RepID=UPI0007D04BD6|nr:STAS domain-containing protein [Rossellomorea aquimaris]